MTKIPDLTAYDVVLPGYPVWYQNIPSFVADFVEQCALCGKTVIPFDYGILKKDNYEQRIQRILNLLNE